jgi:HAMP domain-containing protein
VLAFGVTCAWLLTTGITRPLQEAVVAARRVASGDLTGPSTTAPRTKRASCCRRSRK